MIVFDLDDLGSGFLRRSIPWLDLCLGHLDAATADDSLSPVADGIAVKHVCYDTHGVSRCRFETHRDHVDVQVGLDGGEWIHLAARSALQPATPWDQPEDVIFYASPENPPESVAMRPRRVLVLFPDDSHRCGTFDGIHPSVTKLVFKVHRRHWDNPVSA